jgi:hypothetical protein
MCAYTDSVAAEAYPRVTSGDTFLSIFPSSEHNLLVGAQRDVGNTSVPLHNLRDSCMSHRLTEVFAPSS